jgi:hypothetical protein
MQPTACLELSTVWRALSLMGRCGGSCEIVRFRETDTEYSGRRLRFACPRCGPREAKSWPIISRSHFAVFGAISAAART